MIRGERWIDVPRARGAGTWRALWRPPKRARDVALIFHGTVPRSFDGHARDLAAALGAAGYGTLRLLFRPLEWDRPPSRSEVIRRLPAARAAVRWVRRRHPDAALLLAGSSMGAVIAARISAGASRLLLVSPPFRHKRLGDSYRRWVPALAGFDGRPLVVVGDRDAAWAPLDLVRRVLKNRADLKVLRGADHSLKGFEGRLCATVRRWCAR